MSDINTSMRAARLGCVVSRHALVNPPCSRHGRKRSRPAFQSDRGSANDVRHFQPFQSRRPRCRPSSPSVRATYAEKLNADGARIIQRGEGVLYLRQQRPEISRRLCRLTSGASISSTGERKSPILPSGTMNELPYCNTLLRFHDGRRPRCCRRELRPCRATL